MISKEEAIKRLKEARFTVQPYLYMNEAFDVAIESLSQPERPPQTERPKGRWIGEGSYTVTAHVCRCTNCNREITVDDFDDYCPNCGADMRGVEE